MATKRRMGSDPFKKKDPLGWIGGGQSAEAGQQEGVQGPPGLPSNPEQPSTPEKPSPPGPPSKAGNPSKHDVPSPPSSPDPPGTPSKPPRGSTTSKGLRPGWTRATFIVREETVQQLKAVAYWDRKELKRVVEEAFAAYLASKPVPPIPSGQGT
ncbi:MAG: hypothetical protein AB1664_11640 [Thermodesulfobacteriota bacterium]